MCVGIMLYSRQTESERDAAWCVKRARGCFNQTRSSRQGMGERRKEAVVGVIDERETVGGWEECWYC